MTKSSTTTTENSPLARELVAFERDTNTILVGPTKSGKTHLLKKILSRGIFSGGEPREVYVVVPQVSLPDWENFQCQFTVNVITDVDNFLNHANKVPESSIVVFDDLMQLLDTTHTRKQIEQWFLAVSHHRHLWTFFVTHDMFHKNFLTVRRNTHNFILFNVLADYSSARQFVSRLWGGHGGSLFVKFWEYAVKHFGFVRVDQKNDSAIKTVVSTCGITPDSVCFGARSATFEGPISLDPLAPVNAPQEWVIPDHLIRKREHGREGSERAPRSVSEHGAADVQQSDGH